MAQRTSVPISKALARQMWLAAQRLDQRAPFGDGPDATRLAIEHLGYVQIDTIHVIERCHHHILYSRIPTYRPEDLRRAQSIDKSAFEYWTHALSYVPTRDFRFFIPAMRQDWERRFASVSSEDVKKLLARIEENGPLTIRDIADDVLVEKNHAWASRKPSKRALQLAFYKGLLTISARDGMLKTYELTSRHFGWDKPAGLAKPPKPASETEFSAYVLDRALNAQGFVSLDSICHLDARRKPSIRKLIDARVRRKELVAIALEGAEKQEHWLRPETLETRADPGDDLVHVLSPFDPLIIQRKRLSLVFDYDHRFEAYVPKEKRVFGYFALPILIGQEIAAAIDIKADRAGQKLQIQKWSWVGRGSAARHKEQIEQDLHRFERFQLGRLG